MSKTIAQILEPGENIIWQGGISLYWLGFQAFIFFILAATFLWWGFSGDSSFIFILLLLIMVAIIYLAYQMIQKFILTDKRLILKSGLIGADFRSLYFTEIRSADVRVDLVDKIFNIGTISLNIGAISGASSGLAGKGGSVQTTYNLLPHLDNPYEVYQKIQTGLSQYKETLYSGGFKNN